jgi:hypothetical protein
MCTTLAIETNGWPGCPSPGIRTRAEFLYSELDHLKLLRRDAKNAMLREARRSPAFKVLLRVPVLGPIRVAQIIA